MERTPARTAADVPFIAMGMRHDRTSGERRRIGCCHELLVGEGSSPRISLREARAFGCPNLDDVNAAVDKGTYDAPHVIRSANAILHIGELWELLEKPLAWLPDGLRPAGHNVWKGGHTRTVLLAPTYLAAPRSHGRDAGLERHPGAIIIDMHVSINQSGQKPPILQIEDRRATRNVGRSGRDTHNLAVAHNYGGLANRAFLKRRQ